MYKQEQIELMIAEYSIELKKIPEKEEKLEKRARELQGRINILNELLRNSEELKKGE